ncbi:MAG TPA: hypothetical protein VMT17_06060 [Anaeromyxobacteraceae bacterium]|nr:hypothetical protein [Anaeromyxobacteraceae bacterium]
MTALMLALALTTAPSAAMKVVAKDGVPSVRVTVQANDALRKHGANEEAARAWAELALERCGMQIWSPSDGWGATAILYVNLAGLDQGTSGYFGRVGVQFTAVRVVEGIPFVELDAYSEGVLISGPPLDAQRDIRAGLDAMLDQLCSTYRQAKEEIGKKRPAKGGDRSAGDSPGPGHAP